MEVFVQSKTLRPEHFPFYKVLRCAIPIPDAGIVPYDRFAWMRCRPAAAAAACCFPSPSSTVAPKTSSRCSPSPSRSGKLRIRTGSLKMCSSMMPAQVLRRVAVGVEFIASAVTSAMESQHVELIPVGAEVREVSGLCCYSLWDDHDWAGRRGGFQIFCLF